MRAVLGVWVGALALAASAQGYSGGPPVDRVRIRWPLEAPRDCGGCHAGVTNGFPGSLELLAAPMGDPLPPAYDGEQTYDLLVRLFDPDLGRTRFGFELAALDDGLVAAGTLLTSPADPGVQVTHDPLRTVDFAMQRLAGSFASEWQLRWTAPVGGTGRVTFYLCANAADGNGQPTGDHLYCTSVALPEAPCAPLPQPIAGLRAARRGDDIEWSWQEDLAAARGYRLYSVDDAPAIPTADARGSGTLRDCLAPVPSAMGCTEADGMLDPAGLLYLQVVGVCGSGEEGPH